LLFIAIVSGVVLYAPFMRKLDFGTLRSRVENVTGEDYWASAGGFPGAGYLTIGAPRTVLVSATLDF